MLILIPPSETKRAGGDPARPLELSALSRPELGRPRRAALARLAELSRNLRTATAALHLGSRNAHEAAENRLVRSAPTLAALDRFDGVLFDALDASTLPAEARGWLSGRLAIASALFGLLDPEDRVPAYRLSADTALPGTTLRSIWRAPLAEALARGSGPVVDLRSEAYAALGPAPSGAVFVRVVDGVSGRALNHVNKAAKGRFVRALAQSRPELTDLDDLVTWARSTGLELAPGAPGELTLTER